MSDWQPPPPGADRRLPPMEEQPSPPQQGSGGTSPASPPGPAPAHGLGPSEPEPPDRSNAKILLVAAMGFGGLLLLIAVAVIAWKLLSGDEGPSEPAAAAPTGTLVVASSPEGATVRLGDEVLGTTPLSQEVPPGEHDIRVVKDGHEPLSRKASIEVDEVFTLTAQLEERVVVESDETGKLTLETEPPVKVYVGDELLGETPLDEVEVPSGIVPLELELESGERVTRAVHVKADDVTKTYIDLASGQ